MLYENYQRKIQKIAAFLAKVVKFLPLILTVVVTVMATSFTLLATKGITGEVACATQVRYGEPIVAEANSFLSPVRYEYCSVDSEEWSEEQPRMPGEYLVRAVGISSFGNNRYGDPVKFSILPQSIQVWTAEESIMFGELPTAASDPLCYGDRLVCTNFIYSDLIASQTSVTPDTSAITVLDTEGNDVTQAYTFNPISTSISFEKRPLSVTAQSVTKYYDGQPLSYEQYEIASNTPLGPGDSIAAVFQSLVEPGSMKNEPKLTVYHSLGDRALDVTHHYDITVTPGLLVIEQKPLFITTGSLETVYNGKPVTCEEFSISDSALVEGHQITAISANDNMVNFGTYYNALSFVITDAEGRDVTGNYSLQITQGKIQINRAPLTVVTLGDTWVYDATDHSAEYTVEGLQEGHTETAILQSKINYVGEMLNVINLAIKDATGYDVTYNYSIEYSYGTLKVTPRPLTVYTASDTWVYDGDQHTNLYHTVEGMIEELHRFETCSSTETYVTNVGTVENKCQIMVRDSLLGNDVTPNYSVTYVYGTLEITPRPVTVFTGDMSLVYDGRPHSYSEFSIENLVKGHYGKASETLPTITTVGTAENAFEVQIFDANAQEVTKNYEISYTYGTLEITPRPVTVTTASMSWVYDGLPHSCEEFVVNDLAFGHTAVATLPFPSVTNVSGLTENIVEVRILDSAGLDVTENYSISYIYGMLEIIPRPITVTTASMTWVYDDQPHSHPEFTVDGLVEGHSGSMLEPFASITNVGTVANDFVIQVLDTDGTDITYNYAISYVYGTLEVKPRPITVTTADMSWIYDGLPHSFPQYTVEGLIEGHDSQACEPIATIINAGTMENHVGINVYNADGHEVTYNYEVNYVYGTLEVTPRQISVTTEDRSWVYDAKEHECLEFTATNLVDGHYGSVLKPYATITNVGTVANEFEIMVLDNMDNDVTQNYAITYTYGVLEITPRPLTVITADQTWIYDGQPHSCEDFETENLVADHTAISVKPFPTVTNVGDPVENIFSVNVLDATGKDVTENYEISYFYGFLEILPRPIIVVPADTEKVYDDTPLMGGEPIVAESSPYPLVEGHRITAAVLGGRTDPGVSVSKLEKICIYANGEDVTYNYDITAETGLITVTKRPILVTTASAEKRYDGTPLTAWSMSITEESPYYSLLGHHTLACQIIGSQTEIGSSKNNVLETETRIHAGDRDVTHCYEISYQYGTLTVKHLATIVATSESDSKVYDGTPLTNHGWKYVIEEGELGEGHVVQADVYGTITDPGREPNLFTVKVVDANGEDVTDLYLCKLDLGILTVRKAETISFGLVKDDQNGIIYLKESSWGNYDGREKYPAPAYPSTLPGNLSYNYLASIALQNMGEQVHNVEFKDMLIGMLPYYLGFEGDYIRPSNDIECYNQPSNYFASYYMIPDISKGVEHLKGHLGEYASYEEEYRAFVYDQYLAVDSDTRNYMEKLIAKEGFSLSDPQVISKIAHYIQNAAEYNLEYHPMLDHEPNVAIAFLETYKEGKCTHYALTATLLYRTLGIPARYTEGFMIETQKDVFVDLGDVGHAWVEVYVDGVGWIQVEVTGGDASSGGGGGGGGGGSGDGPGEGSGGGGGGGGLSGDLGAPLGDGNSNTVYGAVKDQQTGVIYLKMGSFLDYTGQGWSSATPYGKLLPGNLSYDYLTSIALLNRNGAIRFADFKDLTTGMLPYYMGFDGDYPKPDSDVYYSHSVTDFSMSYYSITQNANGFAYLKGNLGEYAPYEREYRDYVYNQYLNVDDETRAYMEALIAQEGFDRNDPKVILKVAKYIQTAATYSLYYDRTMDEQSNVVIAFLDQYKEGICSHYAASATLLYRTLGIPARYTVGFMVRTKADTFVDIKGKDAHAWVEVYIDGVGWIQVEVTGSPNGGSLDSFEITPEFVVKQYDGKPLYAENRVYGNQYFDDLMEQGFTYSVSVRGSQTEVGESTSVIESFTLYDPYGQDVTELFNIYFNEGKVQVLDNKLKLFKVYLYQLQKLYDGTALCYEEGDYEILGLPDDVEITLNLSIGLSTVGSVKLSQLNQNVSEYATFKITQNGRDVTSQYALLFDSSDTAIAPIKIDRRKITLTAASQSKIYDGTPLTNSTVTLSQGSLVNGHTLVAFASGSILKVGSTNNTINEKDRAIYDSAGNNVTKNYDILTISGTLTIVDPDEN